MCLLQSDYYLHWQMHTLHALIVRLLVRSSGSLVLWHSASPRKRALSTADSLARARGRLEWARAFAIPRETWSKSFDF
jgi:hypothetical protein